MEEEIEIEIELYPIFPAIQKADLGKNKISIRSAVRILRDDKWYEVLCQDQYILRPELNESEEMVKYRFMTKCVILLNHFKADEKYLAVNQTNFDSLMQNSFQDVRSGG